MPGIRFQLDLYIPEDPAGTPVAGVAIPTALATRIPAIRQAVRDLKAYARRINAGQLNEEMTVRAVYHICHHEDTPTGPCGEEQEI